MVALGETVGAVTTQRFTALAAFEVMRHGKDAKPARRIDVCLLPASDRRIVQPTNFDCYLAAQRRATVIAIRVGHE